MLDLIKPSLARFAVSQHPEPPQHLGRRYDTSGNFLIEPGNTVVSHLVKGSESEKAVIAVRERMLAMPDASRLAFTPVSSLHMTLFQGIIEYRRRASFWPDDVPLDTSIDDMTRLYVDRLQDFEGCGPFNVKVVDVTPAGLTVAGASEYDERILRAWRDALAVPFGYRHPDHDTYVFHITLAYVIERFPDDRLAAWQELLDDCLAFIQREAPVIALNPPAFCSFADMKHFEELVVLD
ncbi:DUF1868 domain-containing protein [Phyllobacterium sp. 628]|uniref:DUF1868 domain-containing protein n=1 Tax=Phyllobacterium sp. 628 TaxID=2718938 RepID=UPI00166285F1|nr:DUF1868 domain-containing protein [Phyllobacterium sp. 628]QND53909.1 DUF1868 domain-containing protein [Phyllobacterium sp. 628]